MRPPDRVWLIEVIEVCAVRGSGTDADPVRFVNQYWTKEGQLLAESNPLPDAALQALERLVRACEGTLDHQIHNATIHAKATLARLAPPEQRSSE